MKFRRPWVSHGLIPGTLVCLWALGFSGCDGRSRTQSAAVLTHIVRDSLLSSHLYGEAVPTIWIGEAVLPEWAAPLADFDRGARFGSADGSDGAPLIGELGAAAIARDGTVALLDQSFGLVRFISSSAEEISVLGGFGDGPGEFVGPSSVFNLDDAGIGVLDPEGGRIEILDIGGEPNGSKRVLMPIVGASDACLVGRDIFALGLRVTGLGTGEESVDTPSTIHQLSGDGELVGSFHVPYAFVSDPMIGLVYSVGQLACSEDSEDFTIWAAYSFLGEIHALTPDGAVKWITSIGDLEYPNQLQSGQSLRMDPIQSRRIEYVSHISLVARNVLAVQVTSRHVEEAFVAPVFSYRTYLLDPETGAYLAGFIASHRVIGGRSGIAVLYRDDPFPEVAIVEVRR